MKRHRVHTLGLVALSGALMLFGGYWFVRFGVLRVRTALAEEQTQMFEDCLHHATASGTPETAVEYLEALLAYYPSGTKQTTGSHLDRTVERARRLAADDIVRHLVHLAGTNHGADPQAWIQRYGRDRQVQPSAAANRHERPVSNPTSPTGGG